MGISQALGAATTTVKAVNLARTFRLYYWPWYILRRRRVLVLGSSGTGKTQVLRSLANPLSLAIEARDRSRHSTKLRLKVGRSFFLLTDTVGESASSTSRNAALRETFRRKTVGIINVVAAGYHEGNFPTSSAVTGTVVSAEFIALKRSQEIDAVDEWAGLLGGGNPAVDWVLTLVNKADLWWDSWDAIQREYQSGPYNDAIARLGVQHVVLPYCATIHRFFKIVSVSGQVDEQLKSDLRNSLLQNLEDFADA